MKSNTVTDTTENDITTFFSADVIQINVKFLEDILKEIVNGQ